MLHSIFIFTCPVMAYGEAFEQRDRNQRMKVASRSEARSHRLPCVLFISPFQGLTISSSLGLLRAGTLNPQKPTCRVSIVPNELSWNLNY
jgi:hypothetical protein